MGRHPDHSRRDELHRDLTKATLDAIRGAVEPRNVAMPTSVISRVSPIVVPHLMGR